MHGLLKQNVEPLWLSNLHRSETDEPQLTKRLLGTQQFSANYIPAYLPTYFASLPIVHVPTWANLRQHQIPQASSTSSAAAALAAPAGRMHGDGFIRMQTPDRLSANGRGGGGGSDRDSRKMFLHHSRLNQPPLSLVDKQTTTERQTYQESYANIRLEPRA